MVLRVLVAVRVRGWRGFVDREHSLSARVRVHALRSLSHRRMFHPTVPKPQKGRRGRKLRVRECWGLYQLSLSKDENNGVGASRTWHRCVAATNPPPSFPPLALVVAASRRQMQWDAWAGGGAGPVGERELSPLSAVVVAGTGTRRSTSSSTGPGRPRPGWCRSPSGNRHPRARTRSTRVRCGTSTRSRTPQLLTLDVSSAPWRRSLSPSGLCEQRAAGCRRRRQSCWRTSPCSRRRQQQSQRGGGCLRRRRPERLKTQRVALSGGGRFFFGPTTGPSDDQHTRRSLRRPRHHLLDGSPLLVSSRSTIV